MLKRHPDISKKTTLNRKWKALFSFFHKNNFLATKNLLMITLLSQNFLHNHYTLVNLLFVFENRRLKGIFFPIWLKPWHPGFSFLASKFWRSYYSKFWIHKRSKDSKRLRTLSLCIPHISFNFSITAKERPFWVSCQLEVRQTRIREFFELFSFFPFDTLSNLLAPLAYLYACPTQ